MKYFFPLTLSGGVHAELCRLLFSDQWETLGIMFCSCTEGTEETSSLWASAVYICKGLSFTVNMYGSNKLFQATSPARHSLLDDHWRMLTANGNIGTIRNWYLIRGTTFFTANICFIFNPLAFLLIWRHLHFCSIPPTKQIHRASLCCKFHFACVRESVRETAEVKY